MMMSDIIFSDLLSQVLHVDLPQGELQGQCCICKKHTNHGFKKKFGANFTASEYISNGDVICPECNHLVENSNTYRRTMFLLTEHEFVTFKKNEAEDVIFNLPDGPFFIYLTKTWQKIGWIRMNDAFNLNNKGVIHFVMDYDIISTSLNQLRITMDFIRNLRQLKIPKIVLETGNIELYHYKILKNNFGNHEARKIIEAVNRNVKNPVYELALYLEK